MKPPIFIFEGCDISVHPTLEHARSFLDAVDVKAGIYEGYDTEGLLLDLKVALNQGREVVIIEEHQPFEYQPDELRRRLIECLKIGKLSVSELEKETTVELTRRVAKHMPWKLTV